MALDPVPVTEPFPISCVAGRYLLFDVNVISHVRRNYNICGVLIGTIPNFSQQNVFLGIPLEITPEEARVLVEQHSAFIVDDAKVHRDGLGEMSREERLEYLRELDAQGLEISRQGVKRAEEKSEKALREKGLMKKVKPDDDDAMSASQAGTADEASLFESGTSAPAVVAAPEKKLEPTFITPTTSHSLLPKPSIQSAMPLPVVPRSYPLFRYLNSRGYFSMPGMRFGCHYSVYPGDPLRFHSHFLATGLEWDEEFSLLDIIGGGRLGTGVKKAYLIGGEESKSKEKDSEDVEPVRAFSIEWAGL